MELTSELDKAWHSSPILKTKTHARTHTKPSYTVDTIKQGSFGNIMIKLSVTS